MLPHVVAHRPALPQRLPSSTNAGGKTPKRNLAVACALSATDPDIAQILPQVSLEVVGDAFGDNLLTHRDTAGVFQL
ncbi:hypothetical protein, partial [Xanthomonas perforans]|uniref:hypothetical protein n=1 Tax=Xanthomonas perforans TaxID=442694 RepID=UPI00128BD094